MNVRPIFVLIPLTLTLTTFHIFLSIENRIEENQIIISDNISLIKEYVDFLQKSSITLQKKNKKIYNLLIIFSALTLFIIILKFIKDGLHQWIPNSIEIYISLWLSFIFFWQTFNLFTLPESVWSTLITFIYFIKPLVLLPILVNDWKRYGNTVWGEVPSTKFKAAIIIFPIEFLLNLFILFLIWIFSTYPGPSL